MVDALWLKPWVGGVRRVVTPLTRYTLSPGGRWMALWGRAFEAQTPRPATTVECVALGSGVSHCQLSGERDIVDLAFVSDDELWVLRQSETPGVATLSVYAVPDGGLVESWRLLGVSHEARLQLATGPGQLLVADALDAWRNADARDAVAWYLFDTRARSLRSKLDPHTVWAWSHALGDQVDLAPWSALRPSLCPDGEHVAIQVSPWARGGDGHLVLLDGLHRRGVTFPGGRVGEGRALQWLGPTQVAELRQHAQDGLSLYFGDGGDAHEHRSVALVTVDDRARWSPERVSVALSPDGQRLLVTALRFAQGPARYAVISCTSRVSEQALVSLAGSHPRTFGATWYDDETLAVLLGEGTARTRLVRYHPGLREVLGSRSVSVSEGSDLFRLQRSPDGQSFVLDWYNAGLGGWQLAVVPAGALK
ncbi:MAG: hypothetical protein JNK72_07575 [Myxococcales bacterium]|nr:hypothetical protein [Myxococcales bacterium]